MAAVWLLAAMLGMSASAQNPNGRSIDGNWWLASNAARRTAFLDGFYECRRNLAHQPVLSGPPHNGLQRAITAFYTSTSANRLFSVRKVIDILRRRWLRAGIYHLFRVAPLRFGRGNEWRVSYPNRDAIVRGFLACQSSELNTHVGIPVSTLVARINAWYGIPKAEPDQMNPARGRDKLYQVILREESPGR